MRLSKLFKKPKAQVYTIAFYNVENLFDTRNDTHKLDDDFTKTSERRWNEKRYHQKIERIAKVISKIGDDQNTYPPLVIGLAEVENKQVLTDLITTKTLKPFDYDFVHYNSPDERGIDTAFLYRKNYLKIVSTKNHVLSIESLNGIRDFTRDVLEVSCLFLGESITFLINHWPSRRDGATSTAYKRKDAANLNVNIIKQKRSINPKERFVVMGDFNDDPHDDSIQTIVNEGFYNPMETLLTNARGTTKYKGTWNLFDQILISHDILKYNKKKLNFKTAAIYDPDFLKQSSGRYKGTPHRTYGGRNYTGGYSDHFPVYILLEKR